MNMLNSGLQGADMAPATGLQGRIYTLSEKDAAQTTPKLWEDRAKEFQTASKAGSVIEGRHSARISEVKASIPEFKDQHGRGVLRAIGNEFEHFGDALKAKAEGRYVTVPRTDGVSERGIISGTKEDPKREGLWIEKDQDNRVRQVGTFQNGRPNGSFRSYRPDGSVEQSSFFKEGVQQGTAYDYNEKSEVVHKREFKDGQEINSTPVDPVLAKQAKAEQDASNRAMRSLKIAR